MWCCQLLCISFLNGIALAEGNLTNERNRPESCLLMGKMVTCCLTRFLMRIVIKVASTVSPHLFLILFPASQLTQLGLCEHGDKLKIQISENVWFWWVCLFVWLVGFGFGVGVLPPSSLQLHQLSWFGQRGK